MLQKILPFKNSVVGGKVVCEKDEGMLNEEENYESEQNSKKITPGD